MSVDHSHDGRRGYPDLMFIPVSGGSGLGELARSLSLARASLQRWPGARIRLVASNEAPEVDDPAIKRLAIDGSPTFHSAEIVAWLEQDPPDVVLFDCTARRSQLDAARRNGVSSIFIASRPTQRRRALLYRTLSRLTEVWVIEPQFQRRPFNLWERLNLRLASSTRVQFLDSVFPESDPARRSAVRSRLGVGSGPYAFFVPGGGGWHVHGQAAAEVFAAAARSVVGSTGLSAVVLTGPLYKGEMASREGLVIQHSLSPEHVIDLVHDAELVVTGGGSIIGQALALRKMVVATALGGSDQTARVRSCADQGLMVSCGSDADALAAAVTRLLSDPAQRAAIGERVAALGMRNDLATAMDHLARLAPPSARVADG
jgi:hypothetical protein